MTDVPAGDDRGGGAALDGTLRPAKEMNLIRRAVREGWPVESQTKIDAVRVATAIMNSTETDERSRVAALKALIEMDKVNQTDHWNEDKNVRLDAGKATERVDGVVLKVAGLDAKD
jgi:hypothetical protein